MITKTGYKLINRKIVMLVISFAICMTSSFNILAWDKKNLNANIQKTKAYLMTTIKNPQIGTVGGDWLIFGLARSEAKGTQNYINNYYKKVEQQVKASKGILHERKYTEYSRVILAITAIGKDPTNVGGYNLLLPLGDYEKTTLQGLNGTVWALLALDSGKYKMPVNSKARVQASRQMYIKKILSYQLQNGGFSLSGKGEAEADITSMSLIALAPYQNQKAVKTAVEKGINCLSRIQSADGGFISNDGKNAESDAQVIVALTELNISLDDSRFVKKGHTVVEHLLTFYTSQGGFKHVSSSKIPDQMSTEQGFYALVALSRSVNDKSGLFRIK